MNPDQALLWNVGTCRPDVKGEVQAGDPRKGESTDAGHRDGAARSREKACNGAGPKGLRYPAKDRRSTGDGRSRMTKAKPFDIPKREVWEAFKKVKANQGAAGVDGQSIADFEVDLTTISTSSGIGCPREAISLNRCGGGHSESNGRDATVGHTNGGGPDCARGCTPVSGASPGPFVPCGLLRLPTRPLGDRRRAHGASALLAVQLGAREHVPAWANVIARSPFTPSSFLPIAAKSPLQDLRSTSARLRDALQIRLQMCSGGPGAHLLTNVEQRSIRVFRSPAQAVLTSGEN